VAITLLEMSKSEQNTQRLAVIAELAEGELLRTIPFQSIDGSGVDYGVEAELPAVSFRGFNEAYGESLGVINPQFERLKIAGGDIDVDTARIAMMGPQAKLDQIQMFVRSMRMTIEDYLINGNEAEDPRAFDGLRTRLPIGSSQAIPAAEVSAAYPLSLAQLDELIDAVEGDNKVLIMNKKMRRRLSAAARNTNIGGFIQYELDEFGKRVTFYNEARIVVTDTNSKNLPIQGFNESTNTNSTSIYCVSFGDLQTTAIQHNAGIQVREMGEVDDAPVDRTRIEWYVGQAIYNGRTAARLYGVKDLAVVA
jgi:hypothetical protein